MNEFKVGDKVKVLETGGINRDLAKVGAILTVSKVNNGKIDGFKEWNDNGWAFENSWYKLVKNVKEKKVLPPKFILQYEIEEDPFELFTTLIEVKARIKELMSKGGHSYKVYEIKKMWTPTVEKKEVITIKGL